MTLEEMASSIGVSDDTYQGRERGQRVFSLEFLLRCCLALNLDIRRLWFPETASLAVADAHVTRELLIQWSRAEQPVTLAQVVELCAWAKVEAIRAEIEAL